MRCGFGLGRGPGLSAALPPSGNLVCVVFFDIRSPKSCLAPSVVTPKSCLAPSVTGLMWVFLHSLAQSRNFH